MTAFNRAIKIRPAANRTQLVAPPDLIPIRFESEVEIAALLYRIDWVIGARRFSAWPRRFQQIPPLLMMASPASFSCS